MDNGNTGGGDGKGFVNKNLIINYLPQALTDGEFSSMFASVGAIKKCRIMRNMQTNYSYGYGFVEYVNPEDADRAIEQLNGLQVQNKKIKVSYARPPGQDIKDTNLYIQNLPRNIDESYLDGLFSPYGKIVQRRLLLDKYTQLPRGVGFVRYSLRSEAQAAIAGLNGVVPEGGTEALNVKVAEDFSKNKMGGMQQPGALPGAGGRGHFGRGGVRGGARGGRGAGRGAGLGAPPAPVAPYHMMGQGPGRGGGFPGAYEAPQAAKPGYTADFSTGYGGYSAGYGDYSSPYGNYSGGYGDYGTADSVQYAAGYGDYSGAFGAPPPAVPAPVPAPAADPSGWAAGRGQLRRGGRGMNKTMPPKSNNRFNPMGPSV
ncbi:Sex-lethal [Amphibalanus amphitrite]|uniref:Sex-lethal n=2 Tax=Amphibalanus amphitrite TaxID=1232801 RepID=A0A6A4VKB6_AMPAM|nr:sex-lethal homolog isoform X1 [Amphibalanus amphitrite]XP_043193399.1 sex-lethal homolog isoform X1 [Amphibalanus amphitrite]XP_043193400.1 sex-lethal homolog isoform X1 [Amphibalanus amphitrite]XP_043193401.1 sex-lethal homolog isoform X1 [Amphibalanus amphitrite]XP_043193402.1 sex-lethal homolog isoform X1 [Amphibalanus amphitrite]XP_043193403.1 sex-lethal homolog isoform X1 [Amphibalanus amphitrite]XP_043193405.1 sex-lethal homolog isoform X1 [Amphibalanus amphitrite]KAF0291750.1 Sex-l